MPYTIEEHQHRFAAWSAGRAASVNRCRFSVLQARDIIEAAGLNLLLGDPNNLPLPDEIDLTHCEWRHSVILAAQSCGLGFSHGVAAKLINVYLKASFVCGGYQSNPNVQALHPPIDSVLLKELSAQNVGGLRSSWNVAKAVKWSKFNSEQYESVIKDIRYSLPGRPLWEVEQYWRGYQ